MFARSDAVGERLSARRCRLCLRYAGLQLQQPSARDVSQREIGIGGQRAVEPRLGAGPCRQQQIDRSNVIADGGRAVAGNRQIKAVLQRHDLSFFWALIIQWFYAPISMPRQIALGRARTVAFSPRIRRPLPLTL